MSYDKLYKKYTEFKKIITDSRKIEKDCIFWALKGENFNGNNFVETALIKGAAFAVTDDIKNIDKKNCFYVENSLTALQNIAKIHLQNLKIPVLAITGSNGKTTTKELLAAVLSQKFIVGYTKGNFNNHIGLPLTILDFDTNIQFAVIEMGANHPYDIKELCEIATPDYGIITNIGKAHIEGFGSAKGVINAKRELYKAVEKKHGTIFYNAENKTLQEILPDTNIVKYGNNPDSVCKADIIENNLFLKLDITFKKHTNIQISSNLFGDYNTENITAAVAIGMHFDIEPEKIKKAIENYYPENNRSQIFKTEKNTLILDAYNANPESMTNSLKNFINIKFEKKIAFIGDMLELGNISDQQHSIIIEKIKQNIDSFEKVYFIGQNFMSSCKENQNPKIIFFKNTDELINSEDINFENRYILLKGSRGIKLEKIIPLL